MTLLLSAFLSAMALAAPESHQKLELSKVKCGSQALSLLKEWKAQDEWRLKFTENENDKKFQAPTEQFGKWVQVHYKNQKDLELVQFSEATTVQVSFDSDCKSQAVVKTAKSPGKPEPKSLQGISYFRDSDLEKVMASGKPAILFLWSPQMQISIEALREINEAAKKLKVPLYALVEPNADLKSALSVAGKLKIPKSQVFVFDSFELTLRDFRLHFPSLIVVNQGKFKSPVQKGHETAGIYEDYVRTHL